MKVRTILFESSQGYFRHWFRLVPPALVLALFVALLARLIGGEAEAAAIAALLNVPVLFVLQAIHLHESAAVHRHRDTTFAQTFAAVRPRLKTLLAAVGLTLLRMLGLGVALVVAIAIAVDRQSMALLVASFVGFYVAYIFLMTRWSMVTPVIVLEELSARKAFKRSKWLVRGHGIGVFLTIALASLITGIAQVALELALHRHELLKEVIAEPATAPFLVLMWTNAYFALRAAHHEPDTLEAVPAPA
jgi:hypothetical protein